MSNGQPAPELDAKKLREELGRLKLKLENSSDKDIRSVLKMRISQIEEQLGPRASVEVPVSESAREVTKEEVLPEIPSDEKELEPPTPEQLQIADRLIAQSRVEKMRGNAAKATDLIKEAATSAPNSAVVMEALGDNLMERKQIKPAVEAYKKAFKLAPKNVAVEEKLATAALRLSSVGSIEDQLRSGSFDSPFLAEGDIIAKRPYAIFLSALFPGTGHLAIGKTTAGLALMAVWSACIIWLLIEKKDFAGVFQLVSSVASHGAAPKVSGSIFIPLFVMAIEYFGCLAAFKAAGSVGANKRHDRPKPPVDLPFD